MKHLFRSVLCPLLLFAAGACNRHTIIPDNELARIFHDAFLTNAYLSEGKIRPDSLKIYEPIFARYGYTTADVQYTIGNFSKRKSARLGDVVEEAIDLLEAEGKFYDREAAVLDTIDNVARRTFTRTVLTDSLIRVRSLRDTAALNIVLDVQPGQYRLSYKYLIDSLDRNERQRYVVWLERADGTRTDRYSSTLRHSREESVSRSFLTDTAHRTLHLKLLEFREKPARPSITVSDLKLEYTPPTETAVDSLYIRQLDIRIFADEFFRAALPADSL